MPKPSGQFLTSLKQDGFPQCSGVIWQAFAKGKWEQLLSDDASHLEQAYANGQVRVQALLNGQSCEVVLQGNPWTVRLMYPSDVSDGTKPIRRCFSRSRSAMVIDDEVSTVFSSGSGTSSSSEDDVWDVPVRTASRPAVLPYMSSISVARVRPAAGDQNAPIDGPSQASLRSSTSAVSVDRVFVWRSNEWHPISETQDRQVKTQLESGASVFDIQDGPYTWTIDTTGQDGWAQISKTTGRSRPMKCHLGQTGAPAPRLPMRCFSLRVPTGSGLVRENSMSPQVSGGSPHGQSVPEGDTALNSEAFEYRAEDSRLTDRLQREWDMVVGSEFLTISKVSLDSNTSLGKSDLIKAWVESSGRAGLEYTDLIVQSIADIFLKMDLNRDGTIDEVEWLHYWLLEQQAPSFHALSQVNELMVAFLKEDPEVLVRLNRLFLESCGTQHDAQLTTCQLRSALRTWREEMRKRYVHNDIADYLEELLTSETLDEDELFSYYDFMNNVLGRRKTKVQLYQYDLSKGGAKWLSPLLVGQQLEGLWHTSIVIYGHEYWYGGSIFQCVPGETCFGTPSKIIDLPEQTMRTRVDFVNFLARVLAHDYTKESYDVLTCNCNHFTDSCCMFLLNQHIPQDVLLQPELVMGSWTMQLLRPVLNQTLGRFEATGTARQLEANVALQEGNTSSDNGISIAEGTHVVWEHDQGWTRIARVLCLCTVTQTCTLKWLDVHMGELHTEIGVNLRSVQKLEESCGRRRNSDPLIGGIFGSRYHKLGCTYSC